MAVTISEAAPGEARGLAALPPDREKSVIIPKAIEGRVGLTALKALLCVTGPAAMMLVPIAI
ncbi:hypothetical protein, partial [Beijerinckia sp. L45]|uniref:hypothetical protein n=1 Tax=Beijerinckia sp. L45 TaxID=1641855 RepID=UPI001AEE79C6